MASNHILKNLHTLIRNSTLTYMNEFVWQDVELTAEFKQAYENHLKKSNYDIEFLGATAVITTPSSKYIYVPNQWFVIASYVVDVYKELQRYKDYFKKVSDKLNRRSDEYAKQLRDKATVSDKSTFILCAQEMFSSFCSDKAMVEEAAFRLWRFVNDYSWWSGQKTIDRGDFYVSVILNMLNLVNVSQGYVADIVSVYANDQRLEKLTESIEGFTTNMTTADDGKQRDYLTPDEEIRGCDKSVNSGTESVAIPRPERVRIKINGTSTLKEFKFKG